MSDGRKEAIKSKLTAAREELNATLNGLTEAQWASKGFAEGSEWTITDVLRHLADSERGMTGLMAQIRGGGEGVSEDFDLARWNQRAVTKLAERSPRELLDGMAESRAALFAFIDSLDEADWDKKGRHGSMKIMTIEEISHLIADHEELHTAGIREALNE